MHTVCGVPHSGERLLRVWRERSRILGKLPARVEKLKWFGFLLCERVWTETSINFGLFFLLFRRIYR